MMMDKEDLDLQCGGFADSVRRAKTLYERQFRLEATVCIKLTRQWNIELYPRDWYSSPLKVFGAADNLGVAIDRCVSKINLAAEESAPTSLAQIIGEVWRTK